MKMSHPLMAHLSSYFNFNILCNLVKYSLP